MTPFYIWRKGLTVYTTLDVDCRSTPSRWHASRWRSWSEQGKNASNASVVAIKNDTGEILAMVGSLDYNNNEIDGQVNMATAERQPGSSFKPYVYLTALQQGMTPATMILDVPTAFPQADGSYYRPENYDRQYHGPVSLRNALARSYNIPAIKVMDQVGVADGAAHRAPHGHQRAESRAQLLRAEPGAGRRRSLAARPHLRLQRLCQQRQHGGRAGADLASCRAAIARSTRSPICRCATATATRSRSMSSRRPSASSAPKSPT
jgi:hypothetical protein